MTGVMLTRRRLLTGVLTTLGAAATGLAFTPATNRRDEPDPAGLRAAYAEPPDRWPAAHWSPDVAPERRHELGLLPEPPFPDDNPYSPEKADLGRKLFFDPRLSASGQIACASCHDPDLGWADGRTVSFGHDRSALTRHAPTIRNTAHNHLFLWDGKATRLEDQALLPIAAGDEMGGQEAVVLARLNGIEGYRRLFADVFGDDVFGDDEVTLDRVAAALATFQRTVNGGKSRFDAFLRGRTDALSDPQVRGLHVFRTVAECINCHNGPNFTDNLLHNTGLHNYGRPFEDLGRFRVTNDPADVGKFKTPTLRDVTRTGPYMHHGLMELDTSIELYDAGFPADRPRANVAYDPPYPEKSPLIRPLNLTDGQKADLLAFLQALEEPRTRVRPPALPE